jgi:NAD(P)-dependent dehydrogenase (short-subunit alcohol dehydrogenase family)
MNSENNSLKNIIITGCSNGLGLETVKKIAKKFINFRIIMACRNLSKANSVKEEIVKESHNNNLVVMEIDTSSLESVKNFVTNYKNSSYGKIYALVCNAGIGGHSIGLSKEGFDIIFATNHLGHFLLVNSLIPQMEENGRIIIVSSDMHDPPKEMVATNFDWIGAEKIAKPDDNLSKSFVRYSYSKLCNIYFTYEFKKRIKDKKVSINAFTPGFIPETGLKGPNHIPPERIKYLAEKCPERMGDLDKSSQALCDIITMKNLTNDGEYFDRSTKTIKTSELSYNEDNWRELWDVSESYVKNYY